MIIIIISLILFSIFLFYVQEHTKKHAKNRVIFDEFRHVYHYNGTGIITVEIPTIIVEKEKHKK